MWLFAVRGKTQPGTTEEFAEQWRAVYSVRFPEMPEFVRAYFSADRQTNTWLALALWSERPDEQQLRQAIAALGGQIEPLLDGPPSAEWLEVLKEV
jgi:hypothetical protein